MLLPALTTSGLARMRPPVTQHQRTLFSEPACAGACLQNPAPTGSFPHQRTVLPRQGCFKRLAFRNSVIQKVTTPAWRSGDPLLSSSSSIAETFCAIRVGESKTKNKSPPTPFYSSHLLCLHLRPLHVLSACLLKPSAGFSHGNMGHLNNTETWQKIVSSLRTELLSCSMFTGYIKFTVGSHVLTQKKYNSC